MDLNALYAEIAAGAIAEVPPEHRAAIADRARRSALSPETAARRDAARIAGRLGAPEGPSTALALVRDPDLQVRRLAFDAAVAAGDAGLSVLRRLTGDADLAIACAALRRLSDAADAPAAGGCRDALRDPRPPVRAAAATLAGRAGGPGLAVDLGRLAADPDPAVRAAAAQAIAQLRGQAERPPAAPDHTPEVWPTDDLPPAADAPVPPTAPVLPAADAPVAPTAPPPEPAAAADPRPPAGPPPDGVTRFAPCPAEVPADPAQALALLGLVSPADRPGVLAALPPLPAPVLQALVGRWRPGGDVGLGRGLALAIAGQRRETLVTRLQSLLGDPQPPVRAAAAEAVGALGGLSTLPWLTGALRDPDAGVVIAAAHALADWARRLGRADLARQWLPGLRLDARPGVAAAAAAALANL